MARTSLSGHIRLSDTGDAFLQIPYDAQCIRQLKTNIPARFRSYNPGTQTWRVWGGYEAIALTLMSFYFPHATKGRASESEGTTAR